MDKPSLHSLTILIKKNSSVRDEKEKHARVWPGVFHVDCILHAWHDSALKSSMLIDGIQQISGIQDACIVVFMDVLRRVFIPPPP